MTAHVDVRGVGAPKSTARRGSLEANDNIGVDAKSRPMLMPNAYSATDVELNLPCTYSARAP